MRQKIFSFLIIFGVWLIFAGKFSRDVIVIGIFASLITAVLFSNMIFRFSNQKFQLPKVMKKIFILFLFIPAFFYEAIISAIKVSSHVFEKEPSFSPGIVKVNTRLTNITAITVLANLITLTPGTLTLDFDIGEKVYYIHWIDVETREEAESHRHLIEKFENWLEVIVK